ncbi:MAG: hypothetical protein GF401_06390 [Chitinivibrionales bacterium]|nr:hypothetical protein [Chitinivibrionales bacterium]
MKKYPGKWHGNKYYVGLHYDLHGHHNEPDMGRRADLKTLLPQIKRLGVDFVQTDCKGHPGYTSWSSKTPGASICDKMKKDPLKGWRKATRALSLPLHCHYSGIWDAAAAGKHPSWRVVNPCTTVPQDSMGQNIGGPPGQAICPRSPYLEKLMIPQLIELIDRYQVDGFWIDGDLWAVVPCYCKRCLKAFKEKTGLSRAPKDNSSPNWPVWINFVRESFEEFVTRYCDAVHKHKPGAIVCSNWLQTLRHPGPPKVPTDWISGDNTWVFGLDDCRCESRFISTRGKHWDIMIWTFYKMHRMLDKTVSWTAKPAQMIQQEAAVVCAFGGSVQLYDNGHGVRDGRLISWHQYHIGPVVSFIKKRKKYSQNTTTIPQIAVLHSETHAREHPGANLMWGVDVTSIRGATLSLLENHYGVDILDEWALMQHIDKFPVVVVPEQDDLSSKMVHRLKEYADAGGKLIISGARAYNRFGSSFLGVKSTRKIASRNFYISTHDKSAPVYSSEWRMIKPQKQARPFGRIGKTPLVDEMLLPYPAASIRKYGKGAVAYIPSNLFKDFDHNHYIRIRKFIGILTAAVAGTLDYTVKAPSCIDIVLRKKKNLRIIHCINRSSGIANRPNDGAVDEIPPVGPITIKVRSPKRPQNVKIVFEKQPLNWSHKGKTLSIEVPRIHIHAAVVIEDGVME